MIKTYYVKIKKNRKNLYHFAAEVTENEINSTYRIIQYVINKIINPEMVTVDFSKFEILIKPMEEMPDAMWVECLDMEIIE